METELDRLTKSKLLNLIGKRGEKTGYRFGVSVRMTLIAEEGGKLLTMKDDGAIKEKGDDEERIIAKFIMRSAETMAAESVINHFAEAFGLGFHVDTKLEDYGLEAGKAIMEALQYALDIAVLELGNENASEIGLARWKELGLLLKQ